MSSHQQETKEDPEEDPTKGTHVDKEALIDEDATAASDGAVKDTDEKN